MKSDQLVGDRHSGTVNWRETSHISGFSHKATIFCYSFANASSHTKIAQHKNEQRSEFPTHEIGTHRLRLTGKHPLGYQEVKTERLSKPPRFSFSIGGENVGETSTMQCGRCTTTLFSHKPPLGSYCCRQAQARSVSGLGDVTDS